MTFTIKQIQLYHGQLIAVCVATNAAHQILTGTAYHKYLPGAAPGK